MLTVPALSRRTTEPIVVQYRLQSRPPELPHLPAPTRIDDRFRCMYGGCTVRPFGLLEVRARARGPVGCNDLCCRCLCWTAGLPTIRSPTRLCLGLFHRFPSYAQRSSWVLAVCTAERLSQHYNHSPTRSLCTFHRRTASATTTQPQPQQQQQQQPQQHWS